jgi:hypothetical protein
MIISFTDYNRSYESQYKFGKFFIYLFLGLFFFNSGFIVFRAIKVFILAVKNRKNRKWVDDFEPTPKGPQGLKDTIYHSLPEDYEKSGRNQYIKPSPPMKA